VPSIAGLRNGTRSGRSSGGKGLFQPFLPKARDFGHCDGVLDLTFGHIAWKCRADGSSFIISDCSGRGVGRISTSDRQPRALSVARFLSVEREGALGAVRLVPIAALWEGKESMFIHEID